MGSELTGADRMNSRSEARPYKRTAVLVVHGMGSQRPLDTVRGVVDAVWLEGDRSASGTRRIWTHPELSGVDIDLPVLTTNNVPPSEHRIVDFHELYWAHLMSETRAVAVLLWLFELARSGPRLKPSIGALYWTAVVFLSVLVLSVSLLAIQLVLQFIQWVAALSVMPYWIVGDFHQLVYVFLVLIIVTSALALIASILKRTFKLAAWSAGLLAAPVLLFILVYCYEPQAEQITILLLPILVAALVIKVAMGRWGLAGLGLTLLLSAGALAFALLCFKNIIDFPEAYRSGQLPWSLTSFWSSAAACYFIAIYLALYATFLQPYLGDAARYFRNSPANVTVRREIRKQAVNTLKALHESGDYDRIVVVAHSLGTVVAYDMLRAYYSRINQALPDGSKLGPNFEAVDQGKLTKSAAREKGREIIRHMAETVAAARQRIAAGAPSPGDEDLRAWLVTDFITLGSPLTHAYYLMCRGDTEEELRADFDRRTREREFPTCPPRMLDGDRRLTYVNPNDHVRYYHHGGQFALTRWTNLYFPVSQLLWGDAIGGEVGPVFGDPDSQSNVADLPVYTNIARRDVFFAHVLYWNIEHGIAAPHITTLKAAIDLADAGTANGLQ
jgi:pimeloyl-ACP methyl ester carboxylesterase